MHLPKIFDFPGILGFPVFRSPKQVRYKGPSFESPKISQNLPKIFPKIPKIIPEFSTSYQKWRTFDFRQTVENVPNSLVFYFRDRRYIFPKKLEIPKLLPKRMALLNITELIALAWLLIKHPRRSKDNKVWIVLSISIFQTLGSTLITLTLNIEIMW